MQTFPQGVSEEQWWTGRTARKHKASGHQNNSHKNVHLPTKLSDQDLPLITSIQPTKKYHTHDQ